MYFLYLVVDNFHLIIYMYPFAWQQKSMFRHRNRGFANLQKNIGLGENALFFIPNKQFSLH